MVEPFRNEELVTVGGAICRRVSISASLMAMTPSAPSSRAAMSVRVNERQKILQNLWTLVTGFLASSRRAAPTNPALAGGSRQVPQDQMEVMQ